VEGERYRCPGIRIGGSLMSGYTVWRLVDGRLYGLEARCWPGIRFGGSLMSGYTVWRLVDVRVYGLEAR